MTRGVEYPERPGPDEMLTTLSAGLFHHMDERTVAIIQARMGSTRFPGKVLKEIAGVPMLQRVVSRTRVASLLDETVVATSEQPGDDEVAAYCEDNGISCHRGSETDVLDRYYRTATATDADTVVRITADCPLVSPSLIDRALRVFAGSDADYVSNKVNYTQPDGLDVEVFGFDTLATAQEEASEPREREHVTPYVREQDWFSKRDVSNPVDTSEYDVIKDDVVLRWTVDYESDLEFLRAVYDRLFANGEWTVDQIAVFELLEREPELLELTEHATPEDY